MIQRIQTLYLLLAAVLMGLTIFLPLATFYGEGHEFVLTGLSVTDLTDPAAPEVMTTNVYLMVLIGLATLLPLVVIFLYKKQFLQVRLCFTETVLLLGTQGFVAYYIMHYLKVIDVVSWKFGIPSVFPIVALVFVVLAIRGIVRDQNLIKSLDRIR